jgi:hypothetical protein
MASKITNKTTIPVEIYTELMHENENAEAAQQIDTANEYLQSLFWLIKMTGRAHNVMDIEADRIRRISLSRSIGLRNWHLGSDDQI